MFFLGFFCILLNLGLGLEKKIYGQCYYDESKLPQYIRFNMPLNRGIRTEDCASRTLKYDLSIECEDFKGTSSTNFEETGDPNDKTSSLLLGNMFLRNSDFISIMSYHNKNGSNLKRTLALQTYKIINGVISKGNLVLPIPEHIIDDAKYANTPVSFTKVDDSTFAVTGIKGMSPLINTYQRDYVYVFTMNGTDQDNISFKYVELPSPIPASNRANNKGMDICSLDNTSIVGLGYSIKQKSVFITYYEKSDQNWTIKKTSFLENSSQNINATMKIACQKTTDNKRFIYFRYFKNGLNAGSLGAMFKYKIEEDYTISEISYTSLDVVNPGDIDEMFIDTNRDILYIIGNFTASSSPRAFLHGYKLNAENIELPKALTREINYVFKTTSKNKLINTLKFTSLNQDSLNNILLTYVGSYENKKKEAGEPYIAPQGIISLKTSEGGSGIKVNWIHNWESYQNYEQEGSKILCSDYFYINKIPEGELIQKSQNDKYEDKFIISRQKCDYKGTGMTLLLDMFDLSCPFGTFYKNGLCRPKSTKCSCFNTAISADCLDSQLSYYNVENITPTTLMSETENFKTSDYNAIKTNALESATKSAQKGCLQFQLDPFICLYQKSFLFETTISPVHLSKDGYGFNGFNELLTYLNQNKDQNKGENQQKIDTYTTFFTETIEFFSNDNGLVVKNDIIPIIPKSIIFNNYQILILPLLETYLKHMDIIRTIIFKEIKLEFYDKSKYKIYAIKLNKAFKDIFNKLKTNRYFIITAIDAAIEYLLTKPDEYYSKTADYLVLVKNLFTNSYLSIEKIENQTNKTFENSSYDMPFLGDINGVSDLPQRFLSLLESFTPIFDSIVKIWADWICKTYYYISGTYTEYCNSLYNKWKYLNSGENLNIFYKEYKENLLQSLESKFQEYYISDSLISTILYKYQILDKTKEDNASNKTFDVKFNEEITLIENYHMVEVYSITIFPKIKEDLINNKQDKTNKDDKEFMKVTECTVKIKTSDEFVKNFTNSTARSTDRKSFILTKFNVTQELILYKIIKPDKVSSNEICGMRVLIINSTYFWCIQKEAVLGGNFNVSPSIYMSTEINISCDDSSADILDLENISYFIKFRASGRKEKTGRSCLWESSDWVESKDTKTRNVVCKEAGKIVDDVCCYEKEKPEAEIKFKYIEKELFIPEVTTKFKPAPIDSKFWKIFLTFFIIFYSLVIWYYATNIKNNFIRLKRAFNRIRNSIKRKIKSLFVG